MMRRTDRLLLVNAMLGQFITGFAGRSFVVALPTIANTVHADTLGISWAIIAYQLAGISLSVVFGRLGDIHGRYALYGTGFAIVAASAFLCGMCRELRAAAGPLLAFTVAFSPTGASPAVLSLLSV